MRVSPLKARATIPRGGSPLSSPAAGQRLVKKAFHSSAADAKPALLAPIASLGRYAVIRSIGASGAFYARTWNAAASMTWSAHRIHTPPPALSHCQIITLAAAVTTSSSLGPTRRRVHDPFQALSSAGSASHQGNNNSTLLQPTNPACDSFHSAPGSIQLFLLSGNVARHRAIKLSSPHPIQTVPSRWRWPSTTVCFNFVPCPIESPDQRPDTFRRHPR